MPLTDLDNRRDWFLWLIREQMRALPGVTVAHTFDPRGYTDTTAFVWLGAEKLLPGAGHVKQGNSECEFAVWLYFTTQADTQEEGLLDQTANRWAHEIEKRLRRLTTIAKTIENVSYSITDARATDVVPGFLDESRRGLVEVRGVIEYRILP